MTNIKGNKGGTKASQSKGNGKHFRPDDKRLKSKRWHVCPVCKLELCHIGSAKCWRCAHLGSPANITGENNPYAKWLMLQQAKGHNKAFKAKVADKQTQLKAIKEGTKATRARAAVKKVVLVPAGA